MPTARAGDIEVRVASATIIHPVLYETGTKTPKTNPDSFLRIALEVRNLSNAGSVPYKSWGAIRPDVEPVILTDNEGNQLKLKDMGSKIPAGRPRNSHRRFALNRGVLRTCCCLSFRQQRYMSFRFSFPVPCASAWRI